MSKLQLASLLVLTLVVGACGGSSTAPAAATSAATRAAATSAATPAATPAPTPSGPPPKIRVATGGLDFSQVNNNKWVLDMKAAGVAEIELVAFENAAQATQATISGATDLLINAVLPIIQLAQASGPTLTIVAVDLQAPDYILVGRKNVPDLKSLEGKKLGISTPGDISDTLSRITMKRAGVDATKVQFVRIGGTGARIAALQAGSIDAGMAHAADAFTAITKSPDLKNLFTVGTVVPRFIQHGLAVRGEFLQKNRALVQKLVDGFVESTRWALKNKAEYIALGKKEMKLTDDAVLSAAYDVFIQSNMFAANGGVDDKTVDESIALQIESESLKGAVPDKAKWLDTSLVQDFLKRKGSQ